MIWPNDMINFHYFLFFPSLASDAFEPCPDPNLREKSPDLGQINQLKPSFSYSLRDRMEYKDVLCLQRFYMELGRLEIPAFLLRFREVSDKCPMNDTEKGTMDFWGKITVGPNTQKSILASF